MAEDRAQSLSSLRLRHLARTAACRHRVDKQSGGGPRREEWPGAKNGPQRTPSALPPSALFRGRKGEADEGVGNGLRLLAFPSTMYPSH
jgi:hypothetical protein